MSALLWAGADRAYLLGQTPSSPVGRHWANGSFRPSLVVGVTTFGALATRPEQSIVMRGGLLPNDFPIVQVLGQCLFVP
jgi:hypothetical protein